MRASEEVEDLALEARRAMRPERREHWRHEVVNEIRDLLQVGATQGGPQ